MMRPTVFSLAMSLFSFLTSPSIAFADGLSSASSVSAVLPGTYTIATLPLASNNQAKYAFDTDLGGGADMVLSDGTYWKHIRQGVVTNVVLSSGLVITPLQSPPIIQLTSASPLTGVYSINISSTNLYPGYTARIIVPSGVLSTVTGLLGSLGISAGGSPSLPIVAGTWEDVQWNGTTLVEIARGTL